MSPALLLAVEVSLDSVEFHRRRRILPVVLIEPHNLDNLLVVTFHTLHRILRFVDFRVDSLDIALLTPHGTLVEETRLPKSGLV